MSYSTGLIGPRFRPWFSWVASASTPATMGADSDVPDWESIVIYGTERIREPVIRATPSAARARHLPDWARPPTALR
jgi:hypothetical protein